METNELQTESIENVLARLPKKDKYRLAHLETEITASLIIIKRNLYEIGKMLSEAKCLLSHGEFQLWIEQKFANDLPYSTAYSYMKIYETFKDNPKSVSWFPITFLMKMSQDEFPELIRKMINDNAEHLDKLDVKEFNEMYASYKKGGISMAQFVKLADKQIKLGIDIEKGNNQRRVCKNMRETHCYGLRDIAKSIKVIYSKVKGYEWLYPVSEGENPEQQHFVRGIDECIAELMKMRNYITKGEGFFRPVIPLIGSRTIRKIENSNN